MLLGGASLTAHRLTGLGLWLPPARHLGGLLCQESVVSAGSETSHGFRVWLPERGQEQSGLESATSRGSSCQVPGAVLRELCVSHGRGHLTRGLPGAEPTGVSRTEARPQGPFPALDPHAHQVSPLALSQA